jgi:hypothetical protein
VRPALTEVGNHVKEFLMIIWVLPVEPLVEVRAKKNIMGK